MNYRDMTPHQKQAYTLETQRLADELVNIKPGSSQRAIACQILAARLLEESIAGDQNRQDRRHARIGARRRARRLETVCDPLDHDHSMNG
jgi:hypothetical protein